MSDEIRVLLGERARHMDSRDLYALLGVPRDAKTNDIKKAYVMLVKRLHPDRLRNVDLGAAAPLADKVFKAINDAFSVLSDESKRADYDAKLAPRGVEAVAEVSPTPTLDVDEEDFDRMFRMTVGQLGGKAEAVASILHGRGAVLFTRGELEEAERYLRRAVELSPNNAVYLRKLGWTLLKNEARPVEKRVQQARRFLESAVAIEPYNSDARYCMAQLYRAAGAVNKCRSELEAVLRCDPKHPRAKVELERLKAHLERQAARERDKEKKPSLLGRLFKRR